MRRLVWVLVALGLASGLGCGGTHRTSAPVAGTIHTVLADIDWAHGQYFLLYDPGFGSVYDVDDASLRVYRDDGIPTNDLNVLPGKAVLDPDGALQVPLSAEQDSSAVRGSFDLLSPGPDGDYEILHDVYAFHDTSFKVIRLRQPIPTQSNQVLAVTYVAAPIVGAGHVLGAPVSVGGRVISAPGRDSGSVLMKLLRMPRQLETPTPDFQNYDESAPLAQVHELELKNVYQLGALNIDPASLRLTVRFGQEDPPITSANGIPFLEVLGLDSWNESSGVAVRGHDGQLDHIGFNLQTQAWVDYARGELFLPDVRPFKPRFDQFAHPFDRFLDVQVNRRRRLGDPGVPGGAADIYELYNPVRSQAGWYLDVDFAAPPVTHARP